MSKKEHRLGVNEINLVVRHLKLDENSLKNIDRALAEVNSIYGLDAVSFDHDTHALNVAYDASRTDIDSIESILKKHSVEVHQDWWTHFKEEYYRFVDQNVKDNAHHEPWSCHNSPTCDKQR